MKRAFFLILVILGVIGCVTAENRPDSYYLSDEYFNEISKEENPWVMESFFAATNALTENDYVKAVGFASKGIDNIPKYRDIFTALYAIRGYAYIMQYNLDSALKDIENITIIDKGSLMIPFLNTYYYLSYAPFTDDPRYYYHKALDNIDIWKSRAPKNFFEKKFSDPARIAEVEKSVIDSMNKMK